MGRFGLILCLLIVGRFKMECYNICKKMLRFITIGQQIPKLFNRAYSEWLPSSGYDKALGSDMEIYGVADSGKYYEEVWLPVVKK